MVLVDGARGSQLLLDELVIESLEGLYFRQIVLEVVYEWNDVDEAPHGHVRLFRVGAPAPLRACCFAIWKDNLSQHEGHGD